MLLIEKLESRRLLSASIGTGSAGPVTFTDGDGTLVTVTVRGAVGTVDFDGTDITSIDTGHGLRFTGTNMRLLNVQLQSAVNAVLVIKAKGGDGSAYLGSVNVSGSLAVLNAPHVNLTGGGVAADDLGTVVLGSILSAGITDRGAALPLRVVVDTALNASLDSAGSIDVLAARSWSSSPLDGITALSIKKISVAGAFDSDLQLTGGGLALASGKFGTIVNGTWDITGDVGKLVAGNTSTDWEANISGVLTSFKATSISGDVTAYRVGQIKAASITNAHLTLTKGYDGTDALTSLSAGVISGSSVRSRSNIRSIKAAAVNSSIFSAGAGTADSIADASDFEYPALIASFKSGAFSDSAILAQNIGAASVGAVDDSVATRPFFGVAAEKIAVLKLVINGRSAALKALDSNTAVTDLLTARGVSPQHFAIHLPAADVSAPPVQNPPDPNPPTGPGAFPDADRLAHIEDNLAAVEAMQFPVSPTSSGYQAFLERYYGAYNALQDTVTTRNALVEKASRDLVDPRIDAACAKVAADLNYEATAIPVEAQEDGWRADFESLAKRVAGLPSLYKIPDNLASIKSLQATALQYRYGTAAWDPQKYYETYQQIYAIFHQVIIERNALVDGTSIDEMNPSIQQTLSSVTADLRNEAAAIRIAAPQNVWPDKFDQLATQLEDTSVMVGIADELTEIKTWQENALQYRYGSAAWDPDIYYQIYNQLYADLQGAIVGRNKLVDQVSLDEANASIAEVRTSVAADLHNEAAAIPAASDPDGWRAKYEALATQVEQLA